MKFIHYKILNLPMTHYNNAMCQYKFMKCREMVFYYSIATVIYKKPLFIHIATR
jgi:hypothetical protein